MGGCEAALDRTLTALAEPHRRHAINPSRERSRRGGELTKIIGLSPWAALSDRQLPEWSTPLVPDARTTNTHGRLCRPYPRDGLYRHREPCGLHTVEIRLDRSPQLCVDATGLGGPFCDVLTEGGIDHPAITMMASASWTRKVHRVTVSNNLLLETLARGFETRALAIAHDLPLRAKLMPRSPPSSLRRRGLLFGAQV